MFDKTLVDEDDTHEFVCVEHHMVPMRDGIRLATSVYRPSHGSDLPDTSTSKPALFHRTPYNKGKSGRTERCLLPDGSLSDPLDTTEIAERFARRGYVVVMQDCRGRYLSEGRFTKYTNEGDDGSDSLDWICKQTWCSGKVGCYGLSYCAHVQVSLACRSPPGLGCLFLESGGFWDAFTDGIRHAGAFTMKQVTWAYRNAKVSPEMLANPELKAKLEAVDLFDWFRRLPWKEGESPLSLAPDYERYIFEGWQSDTFTDKWKKCGMHTKGFIKQFADVPVMIICSWYDPYIGAMTEMHKALSATKRSPIKMILGPWTHGEHSRTFAGDVDFGPQSTFDRNVAPTFQAARLQWFDEHLQGRLGGFSPIPGSSPGTSPPPWGGSGSFMNDHSMSRRQGLASLQSKGSLDGKLKQGAPPAGRCADAVAALGNGNASSPSSARGALASAATARGFSSPSSAREALATATSALQPAVTKGALSTLLETADEAVADYEGGNGDGAGVAGVGDGSVAGIDAETSASLNGNGMADGAPEGEEVYRSTRSSDAGASDYGGSLAIGKDASSAGTGWEGGGGGQHLHSGLLARLPDVAPSHFSGPSSIGGMSSESFMQAAHPYRHSSSRRNALPQVMYFRMGGGSGCRTAAGDRIEHGGQWMDANVWPLPFQLKPRLLYIGPEEKLGQLAPPPGQPGCTFTICHDPRNPVPTIGGNITSGEPLMFAGAYDQVERLDFFGCQEAGRPLSERGDLLCFSTATLEADVELTGACRLVLYFSSDRVDTDFCATIVDVYPPSDDYPDGFAMNLACGIRRARFRDSYIEPSYLVPGQIYRIEVDLNVTSNLFKAGHQIRVDVACSCFPRFDINYGVTKEELEACLVSGREALMQVTNNTIYADAEHPSHIAVPMRKVSTDTQGLGTEQMIPFSSVWLRRRRPSWSR